MSKPKSAAPSRRTALKGIAGLALASGALASGFPAPAIAKTTTVRYTLSWLPTGGNAYVYMARQLGFWKSRGLEVEISRGHGTNAALQAVSTSKFDIGNAGTGAMLLSIIKGLGISAVHTLNYDSGMGVLVRADGPVKAPADLAGRKVAATSAGSDTPFLPAYFSKVGLPEGSASIVYVDAQIIEQSVISGRVDGQVAVASSSVPKYVTQKIPIRFFPFADQGLKLYGSSTMVNNAYLKENRSVVEAFSEGMLEGVKFAMLNPQETIERFLKEHEEIALSPNARTFAELGQGIAVVQTLAEESVKHQLGYTDLADIDRQAKLVREFIGAKDDAAPPPAASYASNDLLGKVTLSPQEWEKVRAYAAPYGSYVGRTV